MLNNDNDVEIISIVFQSIIVVNFMSSLVSVLEISSQHAFITFKIIFSRTYFSFWMS